MVRNKVTSADNIVSIFDCIDENLSETESNDSNETGDNQESDHKGGTSDSEQSNRQATPVVSGWCDVRWQMKIWLLVVPLWHGVNTKYQ
jgi:hypothetical protein